MTAGHTETAIEIHAEQLLTAYHTFLICTNSKIVKENYEVFADVWSNLIGDISQLTRDVTDFIRTEQEREQLTRPKQSLISCLPGTSRSLTSPSLATAPVSMNILPYGYMEPGKDPMPMTGDTAGDPYGASVPMPTTVQAPLVPIPPQPPDPPDPINTSRPTNVQINPEVEVYEIEKTAPEPEPQPTVDLDDNDIVRKAKAMSTMAMTMFQFTRGEGELKTTQDLFTQAEFFAEEANKLYKIVRHFTYQVKQKY